MSTRGKRREKGIGKIHEGQGSFVRICAIFRKLGETKEEREGEGDLCGKSSEGFEVGGGAEFLRK